MGLRRSPRLTPAALAARRANALKCTGPKTPRGKAWSSMNGLRHGWDARKLRAKIERTGDKESLALFDWIFTRFFELCDIDTPGGWKYHERLAARVWCHITGRVLLPRARKSIAKGWAVEDRIYQYSGGVFRPRSLTLLDAKDLGIRFTNPLPSKRRRKRFAWLPEVEFIDPPPRLPRARRVRERKLKTRKTETAPPRAAAPEAVPAVREQGRALVTKARDRKNVVNAKLESLLDSLTLAATVSPLLSPSVCAALEALDSSHLAAGRGRGPASTESAGREERRDGAVRQPEFYCELLDQPVDAGPSDGDPGCSPPCEDCPIWADCFRARW